MKESEYRVSEKNQKSLDVKNNPFHLEIEKLKLELRTSNKHREYQQNSNEKLNLLLKTTVEKNLGLLNNQKKEIEEATAEIQLKNKELEDLNITLLKVSESLINFIRKFQDSVILRVNQYINPKIIDIKKKLSLKRAEIDLNSIADSFNKIESSLKIILSPFESRLNLENKLSSTELAVAELVKNGKNSKEIAVDLKLAVFTVSEHRRHIREKLGLTNQSVNLRNRLLSLESEKSIISQAQKYIEDSINDLKYP